MLLQRRQCRQLIQTAAHWA